jgi:hypothetical protein
MAQESSPEGEYARRFRKSRDGLSVSPVPFALRIFNAAAAAAVKAQDELAMLCLDGGPRRPN